MKHNIITAIEKDYQREVVNGTLHELLFWSDRMAFYSKRLLASDLQYMQRWAVALNYCSNEYTRKITQLKSENVQISITYENSYTDESIKQNISNSSVNYNLLADADETIYDIENLDPYHR